MSYQLRRCQVALDTRCGGGLHRYPQSSATIGREEISEHYLTAEATQMEVSR